jgi:hypothetical protein
MVLELSGHRTVGLLWREKGSFELQPSLGPGHQAVLNEAKGLLEPVGVEAEEAERNAAGRSFSFGGVAGEGRLEGRVGRLTSRALLAGQVGLRLPFLQEMAGKEGRIQFLEVALLELAIEVFRHWQILD